MPVIQLKNSSKAFEVRLDRTPTLKSWVIEFLKRGGRLPAAERKIIDVIDDLSIEIGVGEFIGILGRNGAGKSSLLRILAGIYTLTGGEMNLRGKVASMIELSAGFHGELTGRENIYLVGSMYGIPKLELKKLLPEILEFSELEEFIDMPVKKYSTGMQTRLGFALISSVRPDILLVDEALSVGDAGFQKRCIERISQMNSLGTTVLLVSHAVKPVLEYCRRAIVLDRGKLLFDGSPTDAVGFYKNLLNL